jgi:hypothetical protein
MDVADSTCRAQGVRLALDWASHHEEHAMLIGKALLGSLVAGLCTGAGGLVVAAVESISPRCNGFLLAFGAPPGSRGAASGWLWTQPGAPWQAPA